MIFLSIFFPRVMVFIVTLIFFIQFVFIEYFVVVDTLNELVSLMNNEFLIFSISVV